MSSVREGLSLKAALLSCALLPLSFEVALAQSAAPAASGELPTVDIVATTPLGTGASALDVPSETQTLTSDQIGNLQQTTLQDAFARRTPGVSVTDEIGSPLSESVDFRGETATAVPGTPEGLAVYMNGVRINEAYGDVVNWDLIPPSAIQTADIVTGNPVFGLNALAGAVVMQMKNGFNWQGTEINFQGGMDYTVQGSAQYGVNKGDWAYYVDLDGVRTNGFRYYGDSDVSRAYGDIGYRAWSSELHLSMTGGADGLGVAGTTPLELAKQNPAAVFTTPQTTDTTAEMITLSDETHITPTLKFNGNAYFRSYAQAHVDGNISDYWHCAAGTGAGPGGTNALCNGDYDPATGEAPLVTGVRDPYPIGSSLGPEGTVVDGSPMGEIDRNWTRTLGTGATGQLTDTDRIFGHNNTITAGVSVDQGWSHFTGNSELAPLPPDFVTYPGYGELINDPDNGIAPADVRANNTYVGVYVLDNFDVTDRFSVHAGARFNEAIISLTDESGEAPYLNGTNSFGRINPVVGATFKITPDISAYASYSEANRAPTPLELGCSEATRPCVIDNFLVADPPLKQIVARTAEAGFKGSNQIAWAWAPGRLDWSVSYYHTENQNDIYSVPSPIDPTLGYYTNAGDTLRQGVDVGATYTSGRWDAWASYSWIQASFLTPIELSSPNNPTADANGNIQVLPGDDIPGIPHHKFKFGLDYEVLPSWKVGGDVVYRSSQYYFGAENNSLGGQYNPLISGFATIDLRTSYQVTHDLQIYGLINNVANYRGATYGTLYETDSTTNQVTGNPVPNLFSSNDPRAITVAPPFEAFVGLKYSLSVPPPAPPLVAKY